ncbi:AAA family ATPase [Candidatus Roizmanbacteria bacterium]|jgi:dephospho-CoA kinase|nr:AAA family ATPase [Candidatus Roizmanbacteria bacterium]
MLIGIVGTIASGKEVLADYLVYEHGFKSFSLSTVIHKELNEKGVNRFTRKTLQDLGDELRRKEGNEILAKKTLALLDKRQDRRLVITGIRNPAEIEYLKKQPDFVLIAVKAKKEVRYRRLIKRSKPWDPKTWSDFIKIDRRDIGLGQVISGQQVRRCIAAADYIICNNSTLDVFYKKIKTVIGKIIVDRT